MAQRLIVHVGTPKTGTSYLQDVLFRNRPVLATHGVLYPAERFDGQFLAALDLMKLPWGGLEDEAVGAWDEMAARIRDWPGTAIISHEILAHASRTEIDHAWQTLADDGTEVHVVLSARDLVRQIPAEWQEMVKHRRTISYGRFLDAIRDEERSSRTAAWFWAVQELPDILARWGAGLPPEQVHVVTVPQPGADPSLLWQRFSATFGLDGLPLDLSGERSNPSLGAPETALLRRLNKAVNTEVAPADYRPLVRELLAHQTLSRRTSSPRLAVPDDVRRWAAELSATWAEELGRRGYDVVGDLAELVPSAEGRFFFDPDNPRERLVGNAALDAIRALLLENVRLRRDLEDAERRVGEAYAEVDRMRRNPAHALRGGAVDRLQNSGAGRRALGVYRRARGRNSPSA